MQISGWDQARVASLCVKNVDVDIMWFASCRAICKLISVETPAVTVSGLRGYHSILSSRCDHRAAPPEWLAFVLQLGDGTFLSVSSVFVWFWTKWTINKKNKIKKKKKNTLIFLGKIIVFIVQVRVHTHTHTHTYTHTHTHTHTHTRARTQGACTHAHTHARARFSVCPCF